MTRLAVIGLFLLGACGQPAEQPAQADAGSPAATAPAAASGALADLPDYPGSRRVEVPNFGVAGKDSRSGRSIAMETDAAPEAVAKFYRDWFAANGVPVLHDTMAAQGGLMSAARDGEKGVMLTVSRIQGTTRIGVVRGPAG